MESFVIKDGKRLRRGYTTGSCAAAASKAAAIMLLEGRILESVYLMTPHGTGLDLKTVEPYTNGETARCGIKKDSGDDPDVTNGIVIYAAVSKTETPGVHIDGGEGIGRVTKPGLDQPVGAAAINSTPRRMIADELQKLLDESGAHFGLDVIISAPGGEEIALRTFNPRLGIVGGISVIGTTGIIEPMSDEAVASTIKIELSVRAATGSRFVLMTPGNYGSDYIKNELGIDPENAVTTSNFIGDAFQSASEQGFEGALLVGHIGKIIKLAGGIFNTHSRYGDCRAEIMAAHAGMCGAGPDVVKRVMDSVMTDEMLAILDEAGIMQAVMDSVMMRIKTQLEARRYALETGVIMFSNKYGLLGKTEGADRLLEKLR